MPLPIKGVITLMASSTALFNQLREVVAEIDAEKRAAQKKAEPLSEPGGYQGSSTHPSAKAEDHLQEATEGARSAENTKDVKDSRDSAAKVDNTPDGVNAGKQDDRQLNIGTNQASTGEDASAEDDYKGTKDDPGTSHPMKADDGEKYANWSFDKLATHIGQLGNSILADISNGAGTKTAGAPPAAPAPAVADAEKAAAAGYSMASLFGQNVTEDQASRMFLEATVKEAAMMADLTASYLSAYLTKRAEEDAEGEDHSQTGDAASGASESGSTSGGASGGDSGGGDPSGGGPPAAGGPPAGGAGGLPPELAAALGGAGGGDPMAGGGGDPLAGGGMGGMPGAPGGMPGGMPGGDPMAGGGGGMGEVPPEMAIQELLAAMAEMGITPEMLMQAQQAGGPPVAKAAAHKLNLGKLANAAHVHRRSGKWGFGAPKSAKHEQIRTAMRGFLAELLS